MSTNFSAVLLRKHLRASHNVLKLSDYYKRYVLNSNSPILCENCRSNTTVFVSMYFGFRKYCSRRCAQCANAKLAAKVRFYPPNKKPYKQKPPKAGFRAANIAAFLLKRINLREDVALAAD